jgi:hypothetical protein
MLALCSRIELALYRGRPEAVSARVRDEERRVRRALLDRPPMQGILFRTTLVRHAIACGAFASARAHLRTIRKIKVPVAPVVARLFDGLLAEAEQRTADAIATYRRVLPELARFDMRLHGHAVRARLAGLVGASEGDALRTEAHAFFAAEGIPDPAAIIAMLLPLPSRG